VRRLAGPAALEKIERPARGIIVFNMLNGVRKRGRYESEDRDDVYSVMQNERQQTRRWEVLR
jgi:hypothetical protein